MPRHLHDDIATLGAVLDGIGENIVENPLESVRVPFADESGLGSLKPKSVVCRGLLMIRNYLLGQRGKVRRPSP